MKLGNFHASKKIRRTLRGDLHFRWLYRDPTPAVSSFELTFNFFPSLLFLIFSFRHKDNLRSGVLFFRVGERVPSRRGKERTPDRRLPQGA